MFRSFVRVSAAAVMMLSLADCGTTPASPPLVVSTPGPTATATTRGQSIYVVDGRSVLVFPASASGDVAPTLSIDRPNFITEIATDRDGNIYVDDTISSGSAVSVFSATQSAAASPIRTIALPAGVQLIGKMTTDANRNLYVEEVVPAASPSTNPAFAIAVYAPGATGNVAASRTITTTLAPSLFTGSIGGIAVDGDGSIYVGGSNTMRDNQSVYVFAPTANGLSTPTRTIAIAPSTGYSLFGLGLDSAGSIVVGGRPGLPTNLVLTVPIGSNGTTIPTSVGMDSGGLGFVNDVTVDAQGNVYLAESGSLARFPGGIAVFARGATSSTRFIISAGRMNGPQAIAIGPAR